MFVKPNMLELLNTTSTHFSWDVLSLLKKKALVMELHSFCL